MIRPLSKLALDVAVWIAAAPLAYLLRLENAVGGIPYDLITYSLVGGVLKGVLLIRSHRDRRSWHRTGLRDMVPLVGLVGVVCVLESLVAWSGVAPVLVPRSVPLIEALLAVMGLAGLRFAARLYYEDVSTRTAAAAKGGQRRVIIAGAGEAGTLVAREMLRHPEAGRRPVGYVDDNVSKKGRSLYGLPVLGEIEDLGAAAHDTGADEVLIAMPSADGATVRRVVQAARAAGLDHRTIPALHDIASGRVSVSSIREVNLEDLLRRDAVELDMEPIAAYIAGQTVLVTGAGGSIGSEIVRQIAPFNPGRLVLLGRGENSVYLIDREMARTHPAIERRAVICDVRDEESLRAVFEAHRPDVVFHAAAHKHVPLMEANPEQAIFNNVVGTRNVARLALDAGVRRLVNISTDKAVNPTSIMGASKRVAEMVVSHLAERCGPGQAMVSVRFGNVLGSRGSVVPFFKDQIRRGGPVTVTHPDMIRYFMTIPEASQLVLQAGAIAENGRVYVLDMGQPVRIVDLARDLILLSGLEPDKDVQISFSGVRPGEKLFEELLTAEEGTDASRYDKIFVARKRAAAADLAARLDRLYAAAHTGDPETIRAAFAHLVPSFQPESVLPAGTGRKGVPPGPVKTFGGDSSRAHHVGTELPVASVTPSGSETPPADAGTSRSG